MTANLRALRASQSASPDLIALFGLIADAATDLKRASETAWYSPREAREQARKVADGLCAALATTEGGDA